jgi:hypothetical protein
VKKICLIFAFLLIISGCSKTVKDFDPKAFAADMLAGDAFSDELSLSDNRIGCYLYGLEEADAETMSFYFSSGATAEEMVILKAYNEEGVGKLKDAASARVEYQKTAFESYVPAEVPKLDKAVVSVSGLYVVLYVAADYEAASKAADKYLDT